MAEMTTTSSTIAPKAQIDRFELIEQLTRGTLGVVHKANDTKTNRIVALRFFDLPDWIEDPNGRLQKILAEARNASALNHANITRLVGGGHKELKIYLASDFIEGPTLRELMVSRQLSLDEILGIAIYPSDLLIIQQRRALLKSGKGHVYKQARIIELSVEIDCAAAQTFGFQSGQVLQCFFAREQA